MMVSSLAQFATYLLTGMRFFRYVARRFRLFYLVLTLAAVVLLLEYAATSLMIPMASAQGRDALGVSLAWLKIAGLLRMGPEFRSWLWLFLLLMSARLLVGYFLTVLTTALGKQVHRDLSGAIFNHILVSESMSTVYTRSVGHYITLAGDDTFKSGTLVANFLQILVGFLTAFVGMVVLYQFSPEMLSDVVMFLAFSLLLIGVLIRSAIHLNNRASVLSGEAGTTFIESLNSLRSLRSMHGEKFVVETYARQIGAYVRVLTEIEAVKAAVKALPAVLLLLLAAAVLRPGVDVGMADATLFAGTVIIIRVFASLGQIVTAGSQLLTDIRAIKNINALLGLAQGSRSLDSAIGIESVKCITMDKISFSYGHRGRVLDNVSFQFVAGKTYAIVGPSGAGKSTLADILLGLSSPDIGSVRFNESDLTIDDVRSRIILVEQQSKIFSTSVRDNLLFGAQVSDKDLFAALEAVNLLEVVCSLERGLDTHLTYLGENFSGGQRQRLGIARALVRHPDVLILDEATSALDSETRNHVVCKLRDRMKHGITIFITHDQEIAALADDVLTINSAETNTLVRGR